MGFSQSRSHRCWLYYTELLKRFDVPLQLTCWRFLQGTPQKDVIIKPDAPSTLLSEKHADYIASYGTKKDDYVGIRLLQYSCGFVNSNSLYLFAQN